MDTSSATSFHIKSSLKWPIQTTVFIYWSWDFFSSEASCSLPSISSISTKHRAVHPHGVQQRPHKQARNKTGFVSWGKGAGQLKKKRTALPPSSPPWPTTKIPMFPVLTKFLKGKGENKSLKYDKFFLKMLYFKFSVCCLDYEIVTVSSFS